MPNGHLVREAVKLGLPLNDPSAFGCIFHALFRPSPLVVKGVQRQLKGLRAPYLGLHLRAGLSTRTRVSYTPKFVEKEPARSCPWEWYR